MKPIIKLYKDDLPAELQFNDKIFIDAEFQGLNVKRDKLYLVQISSGKNDAYIIQLNRENYNAPNLKKILSDNNIKKIFHYARADITFIKKYLDIEVENIDCTKVMSKIARTWTQNHGLKDLIKEFKNIDISKKLQSSDFGGNLSDKQLEYCANDVIYLNDIYNSLKNILIREKRFELYQEAIKFLKTRVKLDLAEFSDDIWAH